MCFFFSLSSLVVFSLSLCLLLELPPGKPQELRMGGWEGVGVHVCCLYAKVPPTLGWTRYFGPRTDFPRIGGSGPAHRTHPPVWGKSAPRLKNPVQPDVGGTLVWVESIFADTTLGTSNFDQCSSATLWE